jgi:hypothetical protein
MGSQVPAMGSCKGLPARRVAEALPFGLSRLEEARSYGFCAIPTRGGTEFVENEYDSTINSEKVASNADARLLVVPRMLAGTHPPDIKVFDRDIIKWVRAEAVDVTIAYVGELLRGPSTLVAVEAITSEEVAEWGRKAKAILEETISVGAFTDDDLDLTLIEHDRVGVLEEGLIPYIVRRREVHHFKGLSEPELAESATGFRSKDDSMNLAVLLMDLKKEGQRSFTTPEFRPNGGKNFRQSKSYNDNPALCNRHIFKLLIAGKAVVVPWNSLTAVEKEGIHVNTLQLAPSSNPNREGRCCVNMSYETPVQVPRAALTGGCTKSKLISINEGTDLARSDLHYPKVDLPTARDLCELAETQRAYYG